MGKRDRERKWKKDRLGKKIELIMSRENKNCFQLESGLLNMEL
jgi:hypothetical protein